MTNTFLAINPFSEGLKPSKPDSWKTKSKSGADRTNFDTGNRSYIDFALILAYYQSKSPVSTKHTSVSTKHASVSTKHASGLTTISSKSISDKYLEFTRNILRYLQLENVDKQLEKLSNVLDDSEVKAPSKTTLDNAREILHALYDKIDSEEGYEWIPPFIHGDEFRYVLVVWRRNGKALHFDICEDDIEAVKSWKENSKQKLKPFPLTIDNCFSFWKWWIS